MFRKLPLRSRMTLLTAAAVAVAVAVSAFACWLITSNQLDDQIDQSLRTANVPPPLITDALQNCRSGSRPDALLDGRPRPPSAVSSQVVTVDGHRCVTVGSQAVDVTSTDRDVAAGHRGPDGAIHDSEIADGRDKGRTVRVLTRTVQVADRDTGRSYTVALSVSRDLSETEDSLTRLGLLLALVAGLGVLGAATAGLAIARTGLKPVHGLTEAVEHIARTEDLTVRIPVDGKDEIARLGASFNAMTGALASSQERQQRLIADAGHELRTPLTSLRTNIELLLRSEEQGRVLPPADRQRLLTSLKAQMGELSELVVDLLELSRPDRPADAGQPETVAVHEVVEHALARARLRGPGLAITADLDPWYTVGHEAALGRAVVNLLDNAVKFSPPGGTVDVRLSGGALTVRDHGPGIPEDELPYVFDRFWRSPSARSLPGSGLGLSIVARAAEGAGGRVSLTPAVGGGTVARLDLPGAPTP